MTLTEKLKNEFLIFDGAMGTMLFKSGLKAGSLPEILNIENPELIQNIHRQYVKAGSNIVTTNTFGANSIKLEGSGYSVDDIFKAAVNNAKMSGAEYVAADIGPIGKLLEPMGSLSFSDAYELFSVQVKAAAKNGADLILIETMSDLYECKAATLAAKENCSLPVFCTMTFEENGRTFVGCDPKAAAVFLSSIGADAIGINCSSSPESLIPIVKDFVRYGSGTPVIVQANAGLPAQNGDYNMTPQEYVKFVKEYIKLGASVIGGCCGTTPEFILEAAKLLKNKKPKVYKGGNITAVTTGNKCVEVDGNVSIIGERINPTGKKPLQQALRSGDFEFILNEAANQEASGAAILDVNCSLPDIDEPAVLEAAIKKIQNAVSVPLQIDSVNLEAVERAARIYNGKPIINSVNGERSSMDKIFPIVKKYGAAVVALTLDENGIPPTAEGRFKIAKKIVLEAERRGIKRSDILIDCLVLTASAQQANVWETIKAISLVKERLRVKTVLGVSNVSFGLPCRGALNSAFLAAALSAGLDAPILNPMSDEIMNTVLSYRVLKNIDISASDYLKKVKAVNVTAAEVNTIANNGGAADKDGNNLKTLLMQGKKEAAAEKVNELLKSLQPLDIINNQFIPALDETGERFSSGKIFLPQLMQTAEAATACFKLLNEAVLKSGKNVKKDKIVIATVKGDIHDIGKNIAKMLLLSYGYDVIDLGKDVSAERILSEVKRHNVKLVGLSALMTTTVLSMKQIIEVLKENVPDVKVMAGGAVLNKSLSEFAGADYYSADAQAGVEIAKKVFLE